jgi:hypothetical protein
LCFSVLAPRRGLERKSGEIGGGFAGAADIWTQSDSEMAPQAFEIA